jgi:hypothetical protein
MKDWVKIHKTMICLQTNEEDLARILEQHKSNCRSFRDSDLENMLTAIAFRPMSEEDGRKLFQSYRLA